MRSLWWVVNAICRQLKGFSNSSINSCSNRSNGTTIDIDFYLVLTSFTFINLFAWLDCQAFCRISRNPLNKRLTELLCWVQTALPLAKPIRMKMWEKIQTIRIGIPKLICIFDISSSEYAKMDCKNHKSTNGFGAIFWFFIVTSTYMHNKVEECQDFVCLFVCFNRRNSQIPFYGDLVLYPFIYFNSTKSTKLE